MTKEQWRISTVADYTYMYYNHTVYTPTNGLYAIQEGDGRTHTVIANGRIDCEMWQFLCEIVDNQSSVCEL